ncbi:MAG TPA: hypothetical protein VK184_09330 [Nostocaceae cyanobacterium]|nr:hypothetical protein [Nostocaceae cyanobacterium]
MNRLFRVLASCMLAVVVALGSVSLLPSPAHAQSSSDTRIEFNIPTRLVKGVKYVIPRGSTTETTTVVSLQNKSVSQSASIAFFYGPEGDIVNIPAGTIGSVKKLYNFGGNQVAVQNISDLDNNDVFLTVAGVK